MGVELAKRFEGFEVVIATHIDEDHWHNHLVVNSVNCETGLKIQINEKGLEQLRKQSDEICQQFGMEILQPYQKPSQRAMNQREYRAAISGNSWKMKLLSAIEKAIAASHSRVQFIRNMEQMGYGVKWIDHYKYITYTTPEGQKCRDNRLHDEKYLKTNMEVYFDRLEKVDGDQQRNQRNSDRAVPANIDWSKTRAMERSGESHSGGGDSDSQKHAIRGETADTGWYRQLDGERNPAAQQSDGKGHGISDEPFDGNDQFQAEGRRMEYTEDDDGADLGYDESSEDAGFVPDKT